MTDVTAKTIKLCVFTRARERNQRKSHLSFCYSSYFITPQKVRTKKQANVCANLYGFFSEKGRFFLEKCRTFSEKHRTFPRKCRILSEKARVFSLESALTLPKQATFSNHAGKKC